MSAATRLPPVLLLAVILHTAVLPQLRFFGVGADILLLCGIAAGIAAGPERGATVGFCCGLLADCFLQTPFGLSALVYCLVGWAVGSFQTTILHATWWIPVATVVVASALGTLLFAAVGAVVGQEQLISHRLPLIIGLVAVLNGVLGPVVVRAMRWALGPSARPGVVVR
jgi:rod shape-determining protein MreD